MHQEASQQGGIPTPEVLEAERREIFFNSLQIRLLQKLKAGGMAIADEGILARVGDLLDSHGRIDSSDGDLFSLPADDAYKALVQAFDDLPDRGDEPFQKAA
jgi:hypothetical protein